MKLWLQRTGVFTALGMLGIAGCSSSEGGVDSASLDLGSANLVISQVYGGGGNSGSIYKNDFIEIFNRGSVAVSVSGWSVQYASATGSSWSVTNLSGTIQPGHYYLVKEAAGTGGTTNLPTPDATGT
ncbi:MAG TPA: lamin tail domain-containing protein, partial [Polyangiaceae bacterium]|nr:lamin tail domain-containing protein [Polyangiaceae bacterium]